MTSTQLSRTRPTLQVSWRDALSENPWWMAGRVFIHQPLAMLGAFGMLILLLTIALAPWIAQFDPMEIDYNHPLEAPSRLHPFGTDDLGRDILSRTLFGGRESLRVGILGVLIGISGGVVVGLISGFFGGWVDNLIQRLVDILMAFPYILLLISIVAALGPSLTTVMIAMGFANIPYYTRLVRGSVLSAKNYDYVIAARVVGLSSVDTMFRHILPNIIAPIIIYATLNLGSAIMATAGLSYLGLGAQPPSPEWGAMLNGGRRFLMTGWWISFFPGLMIFFAVLFINLIGDGLRDALDPKLRR